MKKALCIFMIWMAFVAVNAFGIEYPEPMSWVNDYAGVLSTEQQQELDALLKEFENTTTTQIFVAIMDRIPANTSLEAYVNDLFTRWKPGQKDKDNGVLLAIFIHDRKLRIEVGYGLEATLTDAASKLIISNDITPAFKQGEYYRGIRKGLESIILTTHAGYTLPSTTAPSRKAPASRPQPFRSPDWRFQGYTLGECIIVGAFIMFLVGFGILSLISGSYNSGWSSSRSGGFFSGGGGSSGGGGFSGGGGGSSGGGGASGGW